MVTWLYEIPTVSYNQFNVTALVVLVTIIYSVRILTTRKRNKLARATTPTTTVPLK